MFSWSIVAPYLASGFQFDETQIPHAKLEKTGRKPDGPHSPMDRSREQRARTVPNKKDNPLHFKVSSYLKTIIGRDLITDDLVAVFELVKNSFDARATKVDLWFLPGKIYIVDNGKGMTLDDIKNKWLFVAYSAKQDQTEDEGLRGDYRGKLNSKRESFAGNKGVGRFSCDRLGTYLKLQTRSIRRGSEIEVINVDWSRFDEDSKEEFREIISTIERTLSSNLTT